MAIATDRRSQSQKVTEGDEAYRWGDGANWAQNASIGYMSTEMAISSYIYMLRTMRMVTMIAMSTRAAMAMRNVV